MNGLWLDIRYGARVLLKRPMFTGIAGPYSSGDRRF